MAVTVERVEVEEEEVAAADVRAAPRAGPAVLADPLAAVVGSEAMGSREIPAAAIPRQRVRAGWSREHRVAIVAVPIAAIPAGVDHPPRRGIVAHGGRVRLAVAAGLGDPVVPVRTRVGALEVLARRAADLAHHVDPVRRAGLVGASVLPSPTEVGWWLERLARAAARGRVGASVLPSPMSVARSPQLRSQAPSRVGRRPVTPRRRRRLRAPKVAARMWARVAAPVDLLQAAGVALVRRAAPEGRRWARGEVRRIEQHLPAPSATTKVGPSGSRGRGHRARA